jgi:predicted lysophospholipase L1 biosynthesis ABC-type transport system permease subunit
LLIAICIIFVESAVIWGLTFWSALALFAGDSSNLFSSLFLTGILAGFGLWALGIGIGLLKLKRRAHSPALVLQLIFAAIATASFSGDFAQPAIGMPLLAMALICFVVLFGGGIRDLLHRSTEK